MNDVSGLAACVYDSCPADLSKTHHSICIVHSININPINTEIIREGPFQRQKRQRHLGRTVIYPGKDLYDSTKGTFHELEKFNYEPVELYSISNTNTYSAL